MEGMGGMLGGGGGGLPSAAGVLLAPLVYCLLRWCTARSAGVLLAPLVYCLLRWCTACFAGALACSVGVLLASLAGWGRAVEVGLSGGAEVPRLR